MPLEEKLTNQKRHDKMTAEKIDGRSIARSIRSDLANTIQKLTRNTLPPRIATILIGHDPSSELYQKLRTKACDEVGINSHPIHFKDEVTQKQILTTIHTLNQDPGIHGILIQYPPPAHLSQTTLMEAIHPTKDVEGLHPANLGRTLIGDERLIPCTPQAVLTILKSLSLPLKGKNITIINHSTIVGKPLAVLLLNRNATVTVCHEYTTNLIKYTQTADILITATGLPRFITPKMIQQDSIIIDVGITKTPQGITGDVDYDAVKEKAAAITPVPGGVGPVTIACALKNMLTTYQLTCDNNRP